jgi:hypothetical protein
LNIREPAVANTREQYYFDLLKPEYNILPTAGSRLGSKHSEESLAKIRSYKHTPKQLASLRENISKINAKRVLAVEVTDIETGIKTEYNSVRQAAKALNLSSHKIISQYISRKQLTPHKGRYIFKKI